LCSKDVNLCNYEFMLMLGVMSYYSSENKIKSIKTLEFSQEAQVLVRKMLKLRTVISSVWVIIRCCIAQVAYCCYSIKTSFYENDFTISHKPWSNKTLLPTSTYIYFSIMEIAVVTYVRIGRISFFLLLPGAQCTCQLAS
jgi:hypothetical protein